MNKKPRSLSVLIAGGVAVSMLALAVPSANAVDAKTGSSTTYQSVSVSRTFPRAAKVSQNFMEEAVSTEVDEDSSWGGLEELDVPQTKSAAEKAEEQRKRDEEQARVAQEADAQRTAEEQEQLQRESEAAASRAQEREALETKQREANAQLASQQSNLSAAPVNAPSSSKGQAIVNGALALQGQAMDCTMLASKALMAGTGIWFHGWPEDYRNFPGAVEVPWSNVQPGDILVYADGTSYDMNGPGHADHVAIYYSNGLAVHGGYNGIVAIAAAVGSQGIPAHVYRVS